MGYRSLAIVVLLVAAPAVADEPYQPPDEILRRPELPPGAGDGAPRPLELREAIALAARQNLGIALERERAAVARAGVGVAFGRFEPALSAYYNYSNADTPPPVSLLQQGIASSQLNVDSSSWGLGLTTRLPTGTQLSVGWNNVRTLSTSSGATVTDPLLYNAGLSFTLVQPLLRGFAFDLDVSQADLLRARFASKQAALDVRASLIATIKATEDAYWDLVGALKQAEVRRGSLELARRQRLLSAQQIDAGILPGADLVGAESTVAQRELAVIEADAAIARAADGLRRVLNLPRAEWTRPLLPVDPPRFEEPRLDLDESLAIASHNRPEIGQRRIDLARASLDLKTARADRLPALDVGLGYGLLGQQSSYLATLEQMASNNVKSWTAFASFNWSPLMLRAQAQVHQGLAGERAAKLSLERQRLDLLVELRDGLREIETASREVRAAARFRELALRALDVEQRRFQDGLSTNFLIGQRQAELAQAQLAELAAVLRHKKARTAFEAAMGTLIEARGVRLDASAGEQP